MLLRTSKRCLPLLTSLKTQRFTRCFQSSAESKDCFSSSSSSTPAAVASGPSDPLPVHPRSHPTASKFTSVLKFTAFSAITATIGAAGYATYAYTADEVDEKTKNFRSLINHPSGNTTATIDNIPHQVYTAIMTVPSRAVNIYLDLRRSVEECVQEIAEPVFDKLLPDQDEMLQRNGIQTLVLDLKGTLIYNEWKRETGWCTYKRPGLDDFLRHLSQFYEIVIYSDEIDDPLMSQKFMEKGVCLLLSRSHTKYQDGKHYRDLSKLNRDPSRIIYISADALNNCLQPENAVPIKPWKKEADDTTLIDLIPFLQYIAMVKPDIRGALATLEGKDIPSEFLELSKRKLQKQKTSRWRRNF